MDSHFLHSRNAPWGRLAGELDYARGPRSIFIGRLCEFSLTIPYGGMVERNRRRFPALQENHEHRIRKRTSEYLEFFPVS